jgi:hypothetical protein
MQIYFPSKLLPVYRVSVVSAFFVAEFGGKIYFISTLAA